MPNTNLKKRSQTGERGISLLTVAGSMIVILSLAGLAVDVGALYLARSEAQRAADAGALAGATVFVTATCTTPGGTGCSAMDTQARNEAVSVASKNLIASQTPTIDATNDIQTTYTPVNDPRITVTVHATQPTFFMRIWRSTPVPISAKATAEAYNPSSNGPQVGSTCVKPWLLPNCDYGSGHTSPANSLCPGTAGYYINPGPPATVARPGAFPTGVIGQVMTIKAGDPSQAAVPSQFYPVILPPGSDPPFCPTCSTGSSGGGAALYRSNIECCNTHIFSCGSTALTPETGNMVGPTGQGVDCLIHEGSGNQAGQDILNPGVTPWTITGGTSNPNPALRGKVIATSDSVVTMPIFDGQPLCSGNSCGTSANIVGFMQIFVNGEGPPNHTVTATIMNISSCGSTGGGGGGGGGGGTITGGGLTPVPIRLVQNP